MKYYTKLSKIIYKFNVFIITKHTIYTFSSTIYIVFYLRFFFIKIKFFFLYIIQSKNFI